MRNANVFFVVSLGLALATACSSSSSNNASDAGNEGGGGGDSAVPGDDSGASSSSGGPSDGGFPFPMMDATITCMSAADCSEGGVSKVCCFSFTTYSTSCVTGECGMNDFTQCASSDTECPAGFSCVPSPLGMGVHYCAAGDGGLGPRDTGASDSTPE